MEHIGSIKQETDYIWDFWSIINQSPEELTIYTLTQSRAHFEKGKSNLDSERDLFSHSWRRFTSVNGGQSWIDQGVVFGANKNKPDAFDSHSIWTGSCLKYNEFILAAYTGVRCPDKKRPYLQSLGLAVSHDGGKSFVRNEQALSDPFRDYDNIKAHGYYLGPKESLGTEDGEDGKSILAWRDPALVLDSDGKLHLFWAAKARININDQEPAVGHGIIEEPLNNPKLILMPPVRLPLTSMSSTITEVEVPQVIADPRTRQFFLMCSTCSRTSPEQTDAEVDCNVWLLSASTLNSNWQLETNVLNASSLRYPGGLISANLNQEGALSIKFNAPYSRAASSDLAQTMPKIQEILLQKNGEKVVRDCW